MKSVSGIIWLAFEQKWNPRGQNRTKTNQKKKTLKPYLGASHLIFQLMYMCTRSGCKMCSFYGSHSKDLKATVARHTECQWKPVPLGIFRVKVWDPLLWAYIRRNIRLSDLLSLEERERLWRWRRGQATRVWGRGWRAPEPLPIPFVVLLEASK